MKPQSVNILGIEYKIEYHDNPANVDVYKRQSLWGQTDFWTRTIRIYDGSNRPIEDIWHTIFHEVIHGISEALHLKNLTKDENHDELDLLALAINDILFRNDWIKFPS